MRFVDDEYLVAVPRRAIADILAQLAHLIDAAIRRRVDFDHVPSAAGGDLEATGAHAAGLAGGSLDAVQTARQNTGYGRLPRAALAGKDIAMRDAVLRDGVFQRGLDVLLIDHVDKRLGPVFPGYDLVHGRDLKPGSG